MKKFLPIILIIIIGIGAAAFYTGMKYIQNNPPTGGQSRLSPADFQFHTGQRKNNANGFASGEIIAKDEKSITVKLRDGGSKIIFFSNSTEITKSITTTLTDLEIGKNITVSGIANPDGSITAQSIQLRSNRQ